MSATQYASTNTVHYFEPTLSTSNRPKPPKASLADRLGLIVLLAGLLVSVFGFTLKGGPDR